MTHMSVTDLPLPAETGRSGLHVAIIGGGASGVLMAAQLLAQPEAAFRVTLLEGRNMLGCGVAYSTSEPDHLLNTRAQNMSAFPDDPDHFRRWLQYRPDSDETTGQCFVRRATYGAYLAGLLRPWATGPAARRLRYVRQDCVRLEELPDRVVLHLADGKVVVADQAVLATGHVMPAPDPEGIVLGAWEPAPPCDATTRVVIIGSGLSMVDQVLSLLNDGHRGEILVISRRGLLPRAHAAAAPRQIARADVPFGAPVSHLLHWARGQAALAERQGGGWRDAVDAIRPHVREIWRSLPLAERARFLRHAAPWWDVHRHRIPPASDSRMSQALRDGRLRQIRGAFLGATRLPDGSLQAQILPRGAVVPQRIAAARIVDCRGIRRDPVAHATPLITDLLSRGGARIDPLRIGLDVSEDSRIISRAGNASARISAIGPASRAAFWEITAIPDIREQVASLTAALARLSLGN